MRNISRSVLVIFLLTTLAISSFAQVAKPFTLKGKLPITENGSIYLSYLDDLGKNVKDSTVVKAGTFVFKGSLKHPVMVFLTYKKNFARFFIDPVNTEVRSASDNIREATITGSATDLERQYVQAQLDKIEKRWKIVIDTLTAINKRSNPQFQETKAWALKPYFEEQKEVYATLYRQHPSSFVTAQMVTFESRDMSTDSLRRIYRGFSSVLKSSIWGQKVAKLIEERKVGVPGAMATNFKHYDINGKPLELASLRGKYVLLDFWASWCVPCRAGNPHLLKLYAEYKDKGFEIVGIASDDDTPDAWRKAVATDKLVWPQILQGNKPGDDLSDAYNINYLPTKILIDKQGKIIGRFGAAPEELDKMLKSLM